MQKQMKKSHRIVYLIWGGNKIGAKTLDLNKDFSLIAAQLDTLVEDFLKITVA